jgi:hypothetical protein
MISMDKKYKTAYGEPVRILCVDGPDTNFPVIGINVYGIYTWDIHGVSRYENSNLELIEVSEWDDFKIDDKVIVSMNNENCHKRYFAGVSLTGHPMTFAEGTTSWTSKSAPVIWNLCRKPTEEELK